MRAIIIGAHRERGDVEPVTEALPAGELFLSAVPVAEQQAISDRDLLLRVAQIRAQLLERATFVAIRYGFTVTSEADALAKVQPHLVRWQRVLQEHRDHVEMTLKVAASSPTKRPDRREFTSGAEYLKALHAATHGASADPRFREEVERLVIPLTEQHRWIHRDETSIELAALIRRERLDDVRAAGEVLRATQTPFLLSGPWPLEVFADDDHQ
jgi:hypothetical protein